jgi:monoamine oxidase
MKILIMFLAFFSFSFPKANFLNALEEKQSVIVVGAGISGLAAAQRLLQANMDVLVLEAGNRIGGRVWTENPWGAHIENGAAWIYGIHNNPIYELLTAIKQPVIPTFYNHRCPECKFSSLALHDSEGRLMDQQEVNQLLQWCAEFQDYLKKESQNFSLQESLNTYAQNFALSPKHHLLLSEMLKLFYINETTAELCQLSLSKIDNALYSGASGRNVILPNGFSQLPALLAKDVPILLNCKVKRVINKGNRVVIKAEDQEFCSDFVLVTVPAAVLKEGGITFKPPLSEEKKLALQQFRIGLLDKVHLFFPFSFWEKECEWITYLPPSEEREEEVQFFNQKKFCSQPILTAFFAGQFAEVMESWTDQKVQNYLMERLRKIYGDDIPEPSAIALTRWGKDPLFKGSFVFLPLEMQQVNFPTFGEPAGKIYFAGEVASTYFPQTAEEAYYSGVEAAQQIIGKALAKE